MKDRDLIKLIVQNCRKDGKLMLNLSENTIWSDHLGWGFSYSDFLTKTLDVRIKTKGHITDDDVTYSVRLSWFDEWCAKKEFDKLKNEIKQAKEQARKEIESHEKEADRGMLEAFIKNLGAGE